MTYLDANNLHGWAMSQYLLYGSSCGCNSIKENSSNGYILEADFEYLDELHELHNYYPLAPEKLEISHDVFSNYCCNITNKYDIKIGGVNKLVPNLGNKCKYVLHYRNLQL